MIALTANSASGVLRCDVAAAAIRVDTTERPTKIRKNRRLRLRLRMEGKPNRASSVGRKFPDSNLLESNREEFSLIFRRTKEEGIIENLDP